MPLEDLEELGYTIYRPPMLEEGQSAPPTNPSVWGFDRQWTLQPGQDEEEIVAEATNHKLLYDKLVAAQGYFEGTYTNWATMTAQQKDTANRNAQRALRNLIQHVRGDLSSEGS